MSSLSSTTFSHAFQSAFSTICCKVGVKFWCSLVCVPSIVILNCCNSSFSLSCANFSLLNRLLQKSAICACVGSAPAISSLLHFLALHDQSLGRFVVTTTAVDTADTVHVAAGDVVAVAADNKHQQ